MICFFVQITKLSTLFLCIFAKPLVRFLFTGRIITGVAKRAKKQGSPVICGVTLFLQPCMGFTFFPFLLYFFLKTNNLLNT